MNAAAHGGYGIAAINVVDALDVGAGARSGARLALIGRELLLSIEGLQSYFASWDARLYDLLVVAASFDFCDLTTRRPALSWARRFDLRIAVHDPDLWSSPSVKSALRDAIGFLTGDVWELSFFPRAQAAPKIENPGLELKGAAGLIMPFSDGLDSRAVASLMGERVRGVLRVRLGREGRDQREPGRRTEAFMAVPYDVRVAKGERRESSARSRGFKFAAITGIAACLAKVDTVIVTESGQGALGPVVAATGQAYPDYRVHPAFSCRVERLLRALVGKAPGYIYPRIWSTKAETLAASLLLPNPPRLLGTRSCWQQSRQVGVDGRRRQCGICAACLLRRQSLYVAGIEEPRETYVWEDLSANDFRSGAAASFERFTGALEQYAIAGVLHLDHLAAMADSSLHARPLRLAARQAAAAMREDPEEAETKLLDLLCRHRAEWRSFIESLGQGSFIAKLASVA